MVCCVMTTAGKILFYLPMPIAAISVINQLSWRCKYSQPHAHLTVKVPISFKKALNGFFFNFTNGISIDWKKF